MAYISQIIVFGLALVGTFFKGIKEDKRGKHIYSRFGLPVPTRAGTIILILLCASFVVSIYSTYKNAQDNETKEKLATKNTDDLRQANIDLRESLGLSRSEIQSLRGEQKSNYEASSADIASKHERNLKEFASLLGTQRIIGEETAKGIDRVLNPLKKDELKVSIILNVPLEQDILKDYSARVNLKSRIRRLQPGESNYGDTIFEYDRSNNKTVVNRDLLPDSTNNEGEKQLNSLMSETQAELYIYFGAPPKYVAKGDFIPSGGFSVSRQEQRGAGLSFNAIFNSFESADERRLLYDRFNDERNIELEWNKLTPDIISERGDIASFLDLYKCTFVLRFDNLSSFRMNYDLATLKIHGAPGREFMINHFRRYVFDSVAGTKVYFVSLPQYRRVR